MDNERQYSQQDQDDAMNLAAWFWQDWLDSGRAKRDPETIGALEDALAILVAREQPVTVRGVFYRAVSYGAMRKTDAGYQMIEDHLGNLRRSGRIPYEWIKDGTRSILASRTFGDVEPALTDLADSYRRSIWQDQPIRLMVVYEKDALSGVLGSETSRYAVPHVAVRGFDSLTNLWDIAKSMPSYKPTVVLNLGDHDAAGVLAWHKVQVTVADMLADLGNDSRIEWRRIAVTPDQIADMGLLTRWSKVTGPGSKDWLATERAAGRSGEAVDVDAIPPIELRRIVREAIEAELDMDAYQETLEQQREDKRRLREITEAA